MVAAARGVQAVARELGRSNSVAHMTARGGLRDVETVRAAYIGTDLMTRFVIVPLCLAAVFTGVTQGLGTPWGLFRHYWVLTKLLLTVFATVVLLLQLAPIDYMADAATATTLATDNLLEEKGSLVLHSAGGLLVLITTATLSIYKPRGRTRYGWRKAVEARDVSPEALSRDASVGRPPP